MKWVAATILAGAGIWGGVTWAIILRGTKWQWIAVAVARRFDSCRGHWGEIVESTGSRPGLHDLSFLPTLPIAALLAVVFEVMLNRPGVT